MDCREWWRRGVWWPTIRCMAVPAPSTDSVPGPVVCYDGDCRICRGVVGLLPRLGLVPSERLVTIQSYQGEVAVLLHAAGAHNELAVLDPESLEVRSGYEGLLWSFEGSWVGPLLPLARLAPLRLLLQVLYRLVAYNRRILSPVSGDRIRCACDPDFNLGLRLVFSACCGIGALLLGWATGLLGPAAALLGVLGGAALLRSGAARPEALAHAAWICLLVTGVAGLMRPLPPAGALAPPALLLVLLALQRRRALSLGPVAVLGLAGLGALAAVLARSLA